MSQPVLLLESKMENGASIVPAAGLPGSTSGSTVDALLTKLRSALAENPNRRVWA